MPLGIGCLYILALHFPGNRGIKMALTISRSKYTSCTALCLIVFLCIKIIFPSRMPGNVEGIIIVYNQVKFN